MPAAEAGGGGAAPGLIKTALLPGNVFSINQGGRDIATSNTFKVSGLSIGTIHNQVGGPKSTPSAQPASASKKVQNGMGGFLPALPGGAGSYNGIPDSGFVPGH